MSDYAAVLEKYGPRFPFRTIRDLMALDAFRVKYAVPSMPFERFDKIRKTLASYEKELANAE